MKIAITGITGLVGRNVAEHCAKEGHEIIAIVRNKNVTSASFPFPLKIKYGDLNSIETLNSFANGADIIVHCAADTNMISFFNQQQEKTNVTGVKNLVAAAKLNTVKRFIYISTANTIVNGTKEKPGDESLKHSISVKQLPYINSKIKAEELLRDEFKHNGFPVLILNPTFILGPNDYNRSSGKLILSVMKKKLPFYPAGGKNIVDVRDVAHAVVTCFSRGTLGDNYLLCTSSISFKNLFAITASYAGVAPPKMQMPNAIGWALGFIGTAYELLTKKSFSLSLKTITLTKENHYYSAQKAINEIGFSPRQNEETIKDTVAWLAKMYFKNQ